MRPMRIPARARARRADCAPGPGVLVRLPPVALTLMCRAVMPQYLHRSATSCAANIAAYGEASSRSALTFMPPVTRTMVSLDMLCEPMRQSRRYVLSRQISDVDKGVIERGKDVGNAEHKLAFSDLGAQSATRRARADQMEVLLLIITWGPSLTTSSTFLTFSFFLDMAVTLSTP